MSQDKIDENDNEIVVEDDSTQSPPEQPEYSDLSTPCSSRTSRYAMQMTLKVLIRIILYGTNPDCRTWS